MGGTQEVHQSAVGANPQVFIAPELEGKST
jgi:hypothetical protein